MRACSRGVHGTIGIKLCALVHVLHRPLQPLAGPLQVAQRREEDRGVPRCLPEGTCAVAGGLTGVQLVEALAGVAGLCREAAEDDIQHLPGGETRLVEQRVDKSMLVGGQSAQQGEGILLMHLVQTPQETEVLGLEAALQPPQRRGALHDLLLRELPTAGEDVLPDLGTEGVAQGVHGLGELAVPLDGGLADMVFLGQPFCGRWLRITMIFNLPVLIVPLAIGSGLLLAIVALAPKVGLLLIAQVAAAQLVVYNPVNRLRSGAHPLYLANLKHQTVGGDDGVAAMAVEENPRAALDMTAALTTPDDGALFGFNIQCGARDRSAWRARPANLGGRLPSPDRQGVAAPLGQEVRLQLGAFLGGQQ
jgi:hypothetical protein